MANHEPYIHVNLSAVVGAIKTAERDLDSVVPRTPTTIALAEVLEAARGSIAEFCEGTKECEEFSCKFGGEPLA